MRKFLVSVKGGDHVGLTMVKDSIATLAWDKAEIGLAQITEIEDRFTCPESALHEQTAASV